MNLERTMRLGTFVAVLALGFGCGGSGKVEPVEPVSATPIATPTPVGQTPSPEPIADDSMLSNQEPPGDDRAADPCVVAERARPVDSGVPACDVPFNKYMACILEKVPEGAGREAAVDAMMQASASWRDLAADEQTRQALEDACVQMADAWHQAADAMGCTW